jgi:hypothetical protein
MPMIVVLEQVRGPPIDVAETVDADPDGRGARDDAGVSTDHMLFEAPVQGTERGE